MPIKNYTTTVPAAQSVAEIVGVLAAHGATRIQVETPLARHRFCPVCAADMKGGDGE